MICGEVRRYLRDCGTIHVSRSVRDTAYRVLQCKEQVLVQENREPTIDELAGRLGLPRETVVEAMDAVCAPVSLYEPVHSDGGDLRNTDEMWLEHIALHDAVQSLSPREQRILSLRYADGKTQVEVAQEIGISQAQVSRLEKCALKSIKRAIGN